MSIAAYKTTIRQSESPRQIERRILSRLTGALEAHAGFDGAPTATARLGILAAGLRTALAENQVFWGELRHDLALPGNALPAELRGGLLSIALWVDRQTTAVLGGQPGVRALAEVNRNILGGLAAQPAVQPAAQPAAPAGTAAG